MNKDAQKWVKNLLMDWADRIGRMEDCSSIGFPSKTIEGRYLASSLISSSVPSSICPEVMMSRRIANCDQAVKAMNPRLREIIRYKYETYGTEIEKLKKYQQDTGRSQGTWFNDLDKAHVFVVKWIVLHEKQ